MDEVLRGLKHREALPTIPGCPSNGQGWRGKGVLAMPRRLARALEPGLAICLVLGVALLELTALSVSSETPPKDDSIERPAPPIITKRTFPSIGSSGTPTCEVHLRPGGRLCQASILSPRILNGTHGVRGERTSRGDTRLFLRDTAAAPRRPGAQYGETITTLWINSPAMVGNTSPVTASAATPTSTP